MPGSQGGTGGEVRKLSFLSVTKSFLPALTWPALSRCSSVATCYLGRRTSSRVVASCCLECGLRMRARATTVSSASAFRPWLERPVHQPGGKHHFLWGYRVSERDETWSNAMVSQFITLSDQSQGISGSNLLGTAWTSS